MLDDNLRVWRKVETTEARYLKKFNTGSFSGTAIDTLSNVKRATEMWGPIGDKWGVRVDDEQFVTDPTEPSTTVHQLRITLWHPGIGGERAEVQSYGATKFAYTAKSSGRRMVDEDAAKKSMTDAISKALSFLGFSADVYLGAHDSSSYVGRDQQRQRDEQPPANRPPPVADYRKQAADIVLEIAGMTGKPPNLWSDEDRAKVSELVESLCDEAQIKTCAAVNKVPAADVDAFLAACERRRKP